MSLNYFTQYKCENFNNFKNDLIKLIYEDENGKSDKSIYKTDYFSKEKGKWFNLFKDEVLEKFSIWFLKKHQTENFYCEHCWYQIYKENNFHETHTHRGTNFTNIFYLQLPNINSKTQIKDHNFSVEEGDLISFPAFIPHSSKINLSKKDKIIISFNSSV